MKSADERPDDADQLNNLGQLASGVGHHVINAFSAVVSNAELLRMCDGRSDFVEPAAIAEIIVNAAMEASSVARRLIDYSRLATAIGNESFALDQLARELVAERIADDPDRVRWVAEIKAVPPIMGNELQVGTLLSHVLTNAVEALPTDGGVVTLSTDVDQRGWVILEVRDTGRGMTPDVQERAFEPFFTTKTGHFGVGLSIANGIWRRHRGTMSIRSVPGEGTTVRLAVDAGREAPRAATPSKA